MSIFIWFKRLGLRWKLQLGFLMVTMVTTVFNRVLATNELEKMITIAGDSGVDQAVIAKLQASREAFIFNSFWESGIEFAIQFIVIGVVAGFMIRPILRLCDALKSVEHGDLTNSVENTSLDEIGTLERSFNNMRKELNMLLGCIGERSAEMGQSAYQISAISREIADVSQHEQARSSEVGDATKELIKISESVQNLANDASTLARQTEDHAKQGIEYMQMNINVMQKTSADVDLASHQIAELNTAAEKIHNIIDAINAIAEKTNLLSLNAAIEAARAGEQGRGFAVVADEVRGLSLDTSKSLSEISHIIDTLTKQVNGVTQTMGTVVERTNETQKTAGEAAGVIEVMAEEAGKSAAAGNDIVHASRQQSEFLSNLQSTLENLFHTLGESSSKVETTAAIGDDMNTLTGKMNELLSGFTIEPLQKQVQAVQHEKRTAPRENISLLVKVFNKGNFIEGISSNFSLSGVQLRLSEILDDLENLKIQLYLPFDSIEEYESQTPVLLKGRVAWNEQTVKHHGTQYIYGIEFIDLDSARRTQLKYCFDFFNKQSTFNGN